MVNVIALLAIIVAILTIGAQIGMYAHFLNARRAKRCPHCGAPDRTWSPAPGPLDCGNCGQAFSLAAP